MKDNDFRPVIGFDHKRGRRVEWEEFDELLKGLRYWSFERREVSRDGRQERFVRLGWMHDGRHVRVREQYAL